MCNQNMSTAVKAQSKRRARETIVILTAQIGFYHDARYRALEAAGARFSVVATQNEADFDEFMAKNDASYPVHRLFKGRSAYLRACAAGRVWPAVQDILSVLDPTIVAVAGWASPESYSAIAWARRNRRRLVMLSDSQRADAPRSTWREWIKARVVGLCDAALVAGPAHRDYVASLGIGREYTFTGYDVVDNAHFATGAKAARADEAAIRARLALPGKYLLASARFIPKKNLPRLIKAYGQAIFDRAGAPDLVILGDGPERASLEATIVQMGLSNRVHLLGFRSHSELPALYGLSEGFLHVSTSEQWGLVINEATASGVPVVASSACGATASIVEAGETGFVVDAESEVSIKNAVTQLIDLDQCSRNAMGLAGQSRVANWGPDQFANGLLSACRATEIRPTRRLAPWDAVLLHVLSRQTLQAVQ